MGEAGFLLLLEPEQLLRLIFLELFTRVGTGLEGFQRILIQLVLHIIFERAELLKGLIPTSVMRSVFVTETLRIAHHTGTRHGRV